MVRQIMGALVAGDKKMKFLVIDEPPHVRIEFGAGGPWAQLGTDEARHLATALNEAADRMEKENPNA
jgi:hypothetical protein